MNLRLMRLAEHEGTAISDALGDNLWKLLKLDIEPPPVLFQRFKGDWSGTCPHEDQTHDGEVQLNENLLSETRTTSTALAKRKLVQVYLHEWAHRLAEGHGHDAVFAAVNLALLVRANPAYPHLAITGLNLYDFSDHDQDNVVDLANAAAFVMRHGVELGNSDLPVSALAPEAKARFERLKDELAGVKAQPQREAALLDQVENLKRELQVANQLRHVALVGVIIIAALSVVVNIGR
jgi:hypothetical protein